MDTGEIDAHWRNNGRANGARPELEAANAMKPVWPAVPPAVVLRSALPPQPDPSRVKVLHVITRFFGGAGGNTLLSAVGMDQRQYDMWVAGAPGGPLWGRAEEAGVRTVILPHMKERISPIHDLLVIWDLYRLMRRENFSVVHTHCSKAGLAGRVAAWLARVPVVVHTFHLFAAHDSLPAWRRRLYLLLDRVARPLADRYIAVAPQVARQAVETRLAPAGRVTVLPSGVEVDPAVWRDDPSVGQAVRHELGIPDGAPVVGTVGRIVPQKAPLDFVRAAALVAKERPDAVFVMVGDASLESRPLEQQARDEADRLGVDVLFTGFRPDADRVMSAFDVYVVTSIYEGLGRALTEALAAGRPVVATAVNGVPDLVEPGCTGLLARPRDPVGIAASVLWLLDHPAEARRMGQHGRDRVRSLFEPRTMCAMLDHVYADLLGLPEQTPAHSSQQAQRSPAIVPDGSFV